MVEVWKTVIGIILLGLALLILLALLWRYRGRITLNSLGNRLLTAFIGVAVISVALVVSIVIWWTRQELSRRTGQSFEALAETNSDRLVEELTREVELLQELAENPEVYTWLVKTNEKERRVSTEEQIALRQAREQGWRNWQDINLISAVQANPAATRMSEFISRFSTQKQLLLIDQYGGLVAVGGGLPGRYYYGDEVWWDKSWVQGRGRVIYINNLEVKPGDQEAFVEIAVPVNAFGTHGLPVGMLYSLLPVRNLNIFADVSSDARGETVDLALVNKDGQVLYSSDLSQIGQKVAQNDEDEARRNIIRSEASLDLSPQLASLEGLGWTIIVQQPATEALGVVRTLSQFTLFGGLAALALAIVVGVWISRQLARPIENLTDIATIMAAGQLQQAAPVSGPTELQTLARAFNSMTEQLRQILAGLEQQVVARTARLEIIATLGEQFSAILNLETLLPEVVSQIQDRFGYYHAHIYLLDDEDENLVVAAGTGEAGAVMKAAGHSIPLNASTSLVARAARTGQIIRVDNVRETEGWLPNPLLPDTYAEMAVPIILEGRVVGVLDVQENRLAGLDEGDAALLRSLANQLAVAINNARLFAETQAALAEAREIQQRYMEQVWDKNMVARRGRGRVQFSLGESTTLSEATLCQARQQALTHQEPAIITLNGDEPEHAIVGGDNKEEKDAAYQALVAPITLGETTIGDLQLHGLDPNRQWTENELALIKAVIDQVAQTAENLRLFNETQERASREQLIGQISDKLRRAPDIETLMQTAITELSRVLDPARTFVRLGSEAELGLRRIEADDPHQLLEPLPEGEAGNGEFPGPEEPARFEDGAVAVPEDTPESGDNGPEQAEEITPPLRQSLNDSWND